MNLIIIVEKRLKSVKKTLQKKADGLLTIFKEMIKIKKKNSRVETLHSLDYSEKKDSTKFTSKYEFCTVKWLKFKIKADRSVMIEKRLGRSENLSDTLKTIAQSW